MVVWANLNTHLAAGLKRYEAEHGWLTTVRLPPYAPDLNPVEAAWSLVRRAMANTAYATPADLDRTLRRELRRIQLRPHLIAGCLTATGLALAPPTRPETSVMPDVPCDLFQRIVHRSRNRASNKCGAKSA